MHSSRSRLLARTAAAIGAIALSAATLIAIPAAATASDAAASLLAETGSADASALVAAEGCTVLTPGTSCTFGWNHGHEQSIRIDPSVPVITIIATGGSGAPVADRHAVGGVGGKLVAEITKIDHEQPLIITLGGEGQHDGGDGWADGGDGGDMWGDHNGEAGGGGGATAVRWGSQTPDAPFLIAGGGGGGGGCVPYDAVTHIVGPDKDLTCTEGGNGGAGGLPPHGGQPGGETQSQANGNAGRAGSNHHDGRSGRDGAGYKAGPFVASGGGGGGGGWAGGFGGDYGGFACNAIDIPEDPCQKDAPGDGGGGGGGLSFVDHERVASYESLLGAAGNGSVVVIAGAPVKYECVNDWAPRTHQVPEDVDKYIVVATGGSGSRGHNGSESEGRGAAVTADLDVRGIPELTFWVGCSAYDGAIGFGHPGKGGAASDGSMNGGDGGAATMIGTVSGGTLHPLIAAGGGGGSGGDTGCYLGSCLRGGNGGNGGGVKESSVSLDGLDGDTQPYFTQFGGRGGCGDCVKDLVGRGQDGTSAVSDLSYQGGAGGGGGAGYPHSGHGGGMDVGGTGGGGGGAGGSYLASHRIANGTIGTDDDYETGYLLMVPMSTPKTTLTVSKEVAGTASDLAASIFTMHANCDLQGDRWVDRDFQIAPGVPITLPGVPMYSSCTVTETVTGGATTPAPPQTVAVGATPASITMTNTFDVGGSTDVTVHSDVRDADGNPVSGVELNAHNVIIGLSCALDDKHLQLPPETAIMGFTGSTTFTPEGESKTAAGVPIGAECQISPLPLPGTTISVALNGEVQTGDTASFTVAADSAVEVSFIVSYPVASLTVAKAVDGSGVAPSGYAYAFRASCSFRGEDVTLTQTTVSVRAGESAVIPDIPVGSKCTLSETDSGGATAVQFAPASAGTIPVDGATITATNTFSTDPLTVTLSVVGDGADWANTDVDARVTCTLDNVQVLDQTLTFAPTGGTQSIDVDQNAICAITEVGDGGQGANHYRSSQSPDWSDTPVSVAVTGDPQNLTVGIEFDEAAIVVFSENIDPGAKYANTPTAATISDCTFNGKPVLIRGQESLVLPLAVELGGGEAPMVVGADCHVAQSTGGGATEVVYSAVNGGDSIVDDSGATITVNPPNSTDGFTTVTITNVFEVTSLEVSQIVDGAAAWASNSDTLVEVTCTFNGLPLTDWGSGGEVWLAFDAQGEPLPTPGIESLRDLPVGAVCTVDEKDWGAATRVAYSPAPTVTVGATPSVVVTNTFDASEYTVVLNTSGNSAAEHAQDEFLFEQMCTLLGEPITNPQTTPGWMGHFPLTPGESLHVDGLPVGAVCMITMVGTNHATGVLPEAAQSVILPAADAAAAAGDVVTLGVANADVTFGAVFDTTPVTVTQSVDGAGTATYGEFELFQDQLACYYSDDGTRVPLVGDGTLEFSNVTGWTAQFDIPVGADCWVTQSDDNLSTSHTLPPQTIVPFDPIELSVTNSYLLGDFSVRAEARGTDTSAEFGFETLCTWDGTGGPRHLVVNDGQPDFTLKAGETHTFQALMHSTCTVTESDQAGALEVTVRADGRHASTSGATATARATDLMAAEFVFTNYLPGSLPPTGLALGGTLIVVILLLISGALLLVIAAARRRVGVQEFSE